VTAWRTMTPEEHARIADAVQAAEASTSGEIFCVVARSSASYFFPAAFIVTLAIVAVSLLVAYLAHLWWYELSPVTLVVAQLVAIGCALMVLAFFPAIRIHLVPLGQRYRHAHDNAMKQFLSRNIHLTAARTGVMLFVSLAERYAEVVADSGIDSRVPQQTWDSVVACLIAHARRAEVADGFVEAIGVVGALLAEHFPVTADDINELDDHVVEI
jgi:putative membrane protein